MNLRYIKSSEKRKIISELNENFGITKLPYLLIEAGKEKMRAFSGSLSKEEISLIGSITRIESIGLYAMKKESPIRLSFDFPHLITDQLTKNILEINDNQVKDWMKGQNLEIKKERGICLIKHGNYFLGCGKSTGEKIINHVPKDRRLRK